MSKTLVMKFGGTSVGSADALVNAAQIIRDAKKDWGRVVVITSAMSGVTNLLLDSAASASHGMAASLPQAEFTLKQKHFDALDALVKDEPPRSANRRSTPDPLICELVARWQSWAKLVRAHGRSGILWERMSIHLLAVVVNSGIKAKAIESPSLWSQRPFSKRPPRFQSCNRKTRHS
jgi:aspartate kinase